MSSVGQVVGGIVGGVIGFFAGGNVVIGAQIGMMIGGVIDPPDGPIINGPRLDDLSLQTSTYGAFIPRNYGTVAQAGNIMGVHVLVVHALTLAAKVFYERNGFTSSPTQPMTLFLAVRLH